MKKTNRLAEELFSNIFENIKEKEVVIFGEMHGTHEIPIILSLFLKKASDFFDFDVLFEFPINFQKEIDDFFRSGDINILKSMDFFNNKDNNDGRNSLEYLNLINDLSNINKNYFKNICVKFVDVTPDSSLLQNDREREIKDNVLRILYNNPKRKVFVIIGNVHASNSVFNSGSLSIFPVSYLLRKSLGNEKVFSVNLQPSSGEFFNFGVKSVSDLDNSNDKIKKSFDYTFIIPKVSSASFL